jgi:hypothetical protein
VFICARQILLFIFRIQAAEPARRSTFQIAGQKIAKTGACLFALAQKMVTIKVTQNLSLFFRAVMEQFS